jgi:hypothetical protein
VAQPEWHHQKFLEAIMGPERHLVNVIRAHPHLVIPGAQVQLGEEARTMEFV